MWLLVLLFLGAAPAWAKDLGELSANPLVSLVCLVCLVHLVFGFLWFSDQPTK